MSNARQRIGTWGESAAAGYLQGRGYVVLGRNIRTPWGEIDLLVRKDDLLVFVEVRTRTSSSFGFPEESVTRRKQAHMLASAEYALQELVPSYDNWQFDVIAIEGKPGTHPKITHFENVLA